jgi:hypothetical protein
LLYFVSVRLSTIRCSTLSKNGHANILLGRYVTDSFNTLHLHRRRANTIHCQDSIENESRVESCFRCFGFSDMNSSSSGMSNDIVDIRSNLVQLSSDSFVLSNENRISYLSRIAMNRTLVVLDEFQSDFVTRVQRNNKSSKTRLRFISYRTYV